MKHDHIAIDLLLQTVHHLSTEKTEEGRSEATKCNKKMLKFSLSIDDSELVALQKLSHPQPEQNEKDTEDDCFIDDNVLHWPANMSLNVIVDEDSDADNPLCNWDWQPNESQVMPKTTDIAYSKNYLFFTVIIHFEVSNVEISSSFTRKLSSGCYVLLPFFSFFTNFQSN